MCTLIYDCIKTNLPKNFDLMLYFRTFLLVNFSKQVILNSKIVHTKFLFRHRYLNYIVILPKNFNSIKYFSPKNILK